MIRVGLTGGIGSGKSVVAKIFETLGIPVYYADASARKILNEDEVVIKSIKEHFGEQSYKDGILDRSYISSIVFKDPAKLELLNSLTHPATILHAAEWMKLQKTPYVVKEAALIFESGSNSGLDFVIGVYAPAPLRIRRVMERDNVDEDSVKQRMSRQMNEEMKMKLCDAVITNDEQQLVIPQVWALHQRFLNGL